MHHAVRYVLVVTVALAACAAALLLAAGRAEAGAETCTVTATTVPFGSYDVFVAPSSISATVGGSCKKGPGAPSLSLSAGNGLHVQGNGNRAMACTACTGAYASDVLQYQLYTTASLTTVWNATNTIAATNPCASFACTGGGTAWSATFFAEIFTAVAGGINDSSIGTYSDTVVITVNY